MSKYTNFIFFITVFILLLTSASADNYSDLSARYAFAAGNTWERVIKPKFLDVMSGDEQQLVEDIDFRFLPGLGAFDAFAARTGDGQKIVVISGAFVAFQDAALDAMVMANQFGLQDRFSAYLDFAFDKGLENVSHLRNHEPLALVPSFAQFTRLDRQQVAAFVATNAYQGPMLEYRIQSLAYVLGHEIGHHYDGDYGATTDAEQVKREIAADKYSLRLLLRAGFSPWSAVPVMMFFYEGGGDSRHPPPMCRALSFYVAGLPALLLDPDFQAFTNAHPDERAKVDAVRSIIAQHKAEIQIECGDWVFQPN